MKASLRGFICLVFGFLLPSIPLAAQNHRKNVDPCKNNPNLTQSELNDCAGKDLRRVESRLEKVLKALGISKDSPEQKAWEAYRDAQLAALYPELPAEKINAEYGSVYPMCYAALRTELTEGRIRDLKAMTGLGEGDACSGYRATNSKRN